MASCSEDYSTKLGEQEIAKKVTPIDKKRKSKFTISDKVQFTLAELGIELNTTLTKTIKAASEETVLDAIEALKYQLTKQDIPNAGGWLNKAIKEGWTKPKITTQKSTKPEQKIVTASDKPEKKLVDPNKLKKLSNIFNKKND